MAQVGDIFYCPRPDLIGVTDPHYFIVLAQYQDGTLVCAACFTSNIQRKYVRSRKYPDLEPLPSFWTYRFQAYDGLPFRKDCDLNGNHLFKTRFDPHAWVFRMDTRRMIEILQAALASGLHQRTERQLLQKQLNQLLGV